jgi:hypothetical protein
MDRESMVRLRLDRRLIRRRGWIAAEDLARELAALPDVSHKIAPMEPVSEAAGRPAGASDEPAAG